jgi:uncharacterized protein YjbI with pentapeptide repeats
MHLSAEPFHKLDAFLARRFESLFPEGLAWDSHGVARLLQANFSACLNPLLKLLGEPLPSLQGAFLAQVSLQGAIIPGTDLRGANLEEANLEDANLSRSDLQGANLHEARLIWTNLRFCNLQGANLSVSAWVNGLLDGADLTGANLENSSLLRAVASGAILAQANLRQVDLSWSNLVLADFQSADLRNANLRGANLRGAGLVRPKAASLHKVVLKIGHLTARGCRSKLVCEHPLGCGQFLASHSRQSRTPRK